jgi:hypothetical protein
MKFSKIYSEVVYLESVLVLVQSNFIGPSQKKDLSLQELFTELMVVIGMVWISLLVFAGIFFYIFHAMATPERIVYPTISTKNIQPGHESLFSPLLPHTAMTTHAKKNDATTHRHHARAIKAQRLHFSEWFPSMPIAKTITPDTNKLKKLVREHALAQIPTVPIVPTAIEPSHTPKVHQKVHKNEERKGEMQVGTRGSKMAHELTRIQRIEELRFMTHKK